MKLNKYIWMAVLPIAFTACQEEVMVEEYPLDSAVHTISCSIGEEQVEGRAQIVLGNKNRENEIFHWNAGDQFTLFQTWYTMTEKDGKISHIEHNTPYTYTIDGSYSNAEPKGTANFTSIGSGLSNTSSDDMNWIAFYPTTVIDETITKIGKFCTLTIDGSIANNSEESWNEYFKNNMYMRAYGDDNTLPSSISFEHLCGIIRITYTNATQTDHELRGIYVDGTLGNKQEYEIAYKEYGYEKSDYGTSNMHGITFTDKATVAAGTSQDFYILFFPPSADEPMTAIKVDYGVDGTGSFSQTPTQYFGSDFEYSGFMAGKCYWFKITGLDNEKIVWTRDYKPGNEEEQPGTDDTIIDGETIFFENEAFYNALYELWGSQFVGLDSNGNRVISKTKADTETQIIFNDVTSNVTAIQTLSGIENFPNLTTFVIRSSKEARLKIENADFTKNTRMEIVTISQGQLVSLDVEGLANLSTLDCSGNSNLADINLTGCTSLTDINVNNTAITTLTIPESSKLRHLNCGKTNITELNLSSFSSLESLTADECYKLNTLILPDESSKLEVLTLNHTKINDVLDLSKYSQLYRLYCFDCGITDLKLNSECNFQFIYCYLNQISSLNLGKSERLETIYCGQQGTLDEEGDYAKMKLTLPTSKNDMWNKTFRNHDFNKGVVLTE